MDGGSTPVPNATITPSIKASSMIYICGGLNNVIAKTKFVPKMRLGVESAVIEYCTKNAVENVLKITESNRLVYFSNGL
ncbi:unnamed protein product [Thelazia callipaeda]|uniref:FGGY_N domain-containing protein n=1 Tax=Thelazia callipaeda TaxID=103827 RepID=A0A0N5D0Z8_THECL|nr:unnamed protein product [Thelazia callipaeda]